MAQEGKPLGVEFTFVAMGEESTVCVDGMGEIIRYTDSMTPAELSELLGKPDAVTVEREGIDADLLDALRETQAVRPAPAAVRATQHRLREKQALTQAGVPKTPYQYIETTDDLIAAANEFGFPLIVKACTDGYDGKNQWHLKSQEQLDQLLQSEQPNDWIAEPKINFITEVSLIAARNVQGDVVFYPLAENTHLNGILKRSVVPYPDTTQEQVDGIRQHMKNLLEFWGYVGVLAMELFVTDDGFMVNELAPRVHNSGHWSQNDVITSQFENHIRAITGQPLGSTELDKVCGMVNVLGQGTEQPRTDLPDGQLFMYDKEPRDGRKLGHVNFVDEDYDSLLKRMTDIDDMIYSS
jgi:5-(carboxyamino)imidazole ribonucleotide synthase